jgi:hypothetical protein
VDNIKMDLREIGLDGVYWIDVAQDSDKWRTLVNTVMNPLVPWNAGKFLSDSGAWGPMRDSTEGSYKGHETAEGWRSCIPKTWPLQLKSLFGHSFLILKENSRMLMRSPCCLCVYVSSPMRWVSYPRETDEQFSPELPV